MRKVNSPHSTVLNSGKPHNHPMKPLLNTFIIFAAMYMAFVVIYGICASTIPADIASSLPALYILQSAQTILVFGISGLAAAGLNGERHLTAAIGFGHCTLRNILLAAAVAVCALPFTSVIGDLNSAISFPDSLHQLENQLKSMEEAARLTTERMMQTESYANLAINIMVMAVLPALCEEIFFRGTVQRYLQQSYNKHIAVWTTAILFSTVHFQFFGFIPRMLMGAGLGYMYLFTGSLWIPVTAHFINNAIVVTATFYSYNTLTSPAVFNGFTTWYVALASLSATVALLYKMRSEKIVAISNVRH
ncbi:MAG: type II CAAX prenyl endopeptidase Rce1 family protein [Candidatus Aphodosoma sp.]